MARNSSSHTWLISSLTLIASFLMGLIDAYTFLEQDGSFASAQTGNLVGLSVKLYSGEFVETLSHFSVFGGFALGAFLGEALIEKFHWKNTEKSKLILILQAILLAFLALFQSMIPGTMMLFFLGLLAGYELTVFRLFRGTKVNNGIMTGNTKNMMNNVYKAIFEKDKQARKAFFNIFIVIIVFLVGVGVGAAIIQASSSLILWAAFIVVILALGITMSSNKANNEHVQ